MAANPFVKGWKYLMAAFGAQIDERADPKIQIQQATEEAQNQHARLTQQAAAVIGNKRQLEMKMARAMEEASKLQSAARQALLIAEKSRADGDDAAAAKYEQTAQTFATQLVAAEANLHSLQEMHAQADAAAAQAQQAVQDSGARLQSRLAERTQLLSQLEQAKMQEQVSASLQSISALGAPGTTPTLDEVRNKIEGRYAKALGQAELAADSPEGRMLDVERASLDAAGSNRLDAIRASMNPTAITAGDPADR